MRDFESPKDVYSTDPGSSFDLLIVVYAIPDQYPASDVTQLRHKFPLAGIIQWLGPWGEGASRTGRPCPGLARKRWSEARAWLELQLDRWNQSLCPQWYGDFAGSCDLEIAAANLRSQRSPMIGIITAHPTLSESYLSLLSSLGYNGVLVSWPPDLNSTIDIYLWDETAWMGHASPELRHVVLALAPIPIIALVNGLRPAERNRWKNAGVSHVIGKPFVADQLTSAIERMAGTTPGRDFERPQPTEGSY